MIRRVVLGVATVLVDKVIIAGVQLMLVPVLALHWGIPVYGAWVLLATIPGFLSMSDFGFGGAAGTRVTMLVAAGEREEALNVFQSGWTALVVASTVALSLAVLAVWTVPSGMLPTASGFDANEARLTLTLLVLYGVVAMQGDILAAGFRSHQRFALATLMMAFTILAENGAAIAIVAFGGRPAHAAAALLGMRTLGLLVQWRVLRLVVPWLPLGWTHAKRKDARALLPFALAVAMIPLGQALFLQGTVIALGVAAGAAAVPAFAAVRTLSRMGLQFTQLLTLVLMPEFSAAVGRSDRQAQATMLVATLGVFTLIVTPFAILFMLLGAKFVALWTHGAIRPDQGLIIAFGCALLPGGFWNPLSNLILAMNRQAGFSYPYLALALLTVPVTYVLSLNMGATGAAWSVVFLDAAMCIVILRQARRLLPNRTESRDALREIARRGRTLLSDRMRGTGPHAG